MNEYEDPIEATYQFPTDPEVVVSKVFFEIGDKIIEGKVQEK